MDKLIQLFGRRTAEFITVLYASVIKRWVAKATQASGTNINTKGGYNFEWCWNLILMKKKG